MDERYVNGIPVVTKMKYDFKELPVFVCQDNTLYMLQTFRPLNHTETAFFYQYERKTPSFSYGDISDKSQYLEV